MIMLVSPAEPVRPSAVVGAFVLSPRILRLFTFARCSPDTNWLHFHSKVDATFVPLKGLQAGVKRAVVAAGITAVSRVWARIKLAAYGLRSQSWCTEGRAYPPGGDL